MRIKRGSGLRFNNWFPFRPVRLGPPWPGSWPDPRGIPTPRNNPSPKQKGVRLSPFCPRPRTMFGQVHNFSVALVWNIVQSLRGGTAREA
jgi:hypothetical protein